MLSINALHKYYGSTPVLLDINLEIFDGEKVGIVGKNGCGKTTLFKIIAKDLDYDSGSVSIKKGKTVGIIDQIPFFDDNATVEDVLKTAFSHVINLQQKAKELETKMADGDTDVMAEYSKVLEQIELAGGYNFDFEIDIVCNGLEISADMRKKEFCVLSGGEKTRVNLARIILEKTDLLLLDEPTNHLDMSACIWLTNYLENYKGTVVTISHDRYFLDQVVTKIIEIDNHKTDIYHGNYSYYAVEKEVRVKRQLEDHLREAKALKELQDASTKMHSWGTERMHKRAFSIDKRIEKMSVTDRPKVEKNISVNFNTIEYKTEELLKVRDISKAYENSKIIENITFNMTNGDKIAIIGDNGTGKSTFLKILLGLEEQDRGSIKKGLGLSLGYLPQIVKFENDTRNLIDTLIYEKDVTAQTARNRLGAFKFTGEDQLKTVNKLSGGEKSRLRLCTLMYDDVNLLILDEPTNHLDIISREWIEEAVESFDGSLIFVSHDRYFISRFANVIIELTKDGYWYHKGSYEDYLYQKELGKVDFIPKNNAITVDESSHSHLQNVQNKTTQKGKPKQLDKMAEKKAKSLEREIKTIDEKIAEIDKQMCENSQDFSKLTELSNQKDELELELLDKMEQWDKILGEMDC